MEGLTVLGVSEEKQCVVFRFPCPNCGGPWKINSRLKGRLECVVCHAVFEPVRLIFGVLADGNHIGDYHERTN